MYYLLLIIFTGSLFSQPWMDNLNESQKNNFYEIQNSFNQWVADKDQSQKGLGIKQYRRWEEFWRHRVYEDGRFPTGIEIEKAFNETKKSKNHTLQSSLDWQFIGRTSSPGGYNGLGRVSVVKDDPNNSNIWWAGAAAGGLWKTTNKGQSWTTNTDNIQNLTTLGISDIIIDPSNSNIMYIGTGDRDATNTYGVGILKSTNGGTSWNTTGFSYGVNSYVIVNRMVINPTNTNKLIAATNNGIYVTTDGGANWNRTLTNNCKDIKLKPNDPNTVYATIYKNPSEFYKSTDGGSNWTKITSGLPSSNIRRIEIAVTPDANNNVYLLACNNSYALRGVYLSTDSGDNFSLLSDTPNMLSGDKDGGGTGGQGWYDLTIAVPADDKNTIFIGGIVVWKTTNLGTDWKLNTFWYPISNTETIHADQHYFHFAKDGTFLVGNDGGVYSSTNKGTDWDYKSDGMGITQCYKISTSQTTLDFFLLGSQDNGSMLKKKNGDWDDVLGGDGMYCLIDPTNDAKMYASVQYGNPIAKSTNSGATWKRINDTNNNDEYDDIDETGAWVTPYALDPTNTDVMYLGMNSMWKSTNGGTNFTKIVVGNSSKFEEMYVPDKNNNYVYASSSNQFFRSVNKGNNWSEVSRPGNQTISHFCVHPDNENILWATNSGWNSTNKVFYSTDGGDNWTNISTGLPNLPVNCVTFQKNMNNRVYIGTDIGIYYKDDNSNGWVYFSSGLPNVIVNDIVINESQGRMYAGTYGRGVWYIDIDIQLDIPVLESPITLTKNLEINNLTLKWFSSNLATNYHLQGSKQSNFSTIDFEITNTPDTTFNVNNLSYNQTYYWRVKAKAGGNESDWSEVWNFKTKIGKTTLVSPSNNKFNEVNSPDFRWNQVSSAIKYYIEISDTPTFSNLVKNDSTNNVSITLSGLSYNTKYYWRVKLLGPDGMSDWSETWNFTVKLAAPQLSIPLNNTKNADLATKLEWSSVNGGQTYDIQIDDNQDFSSMVKHITNHGLIDYTTAGLEYGKKYYWKIKANNSSSSSDWSETWNFTTQISSSNLVYPPNDSNYLDTNLTLVWTDVPLADTFLLQVSEDFTFQTLIIDDKLETINFNLPDLDHNKLLYWRVKAISAESESAWSEIRNFRIKLRTPILKTPLNNATDIVVNSELEWNTVNDATKYLINISDKLDFSTTVIEEEVNGNKFKFNSSTNKVYYWRTKALTSANKSDWSETWKFSTPIETPVLISPVDKSVVNKTDTILTWNEVSGATEYQLDFSTDATFATKILDNKSINDDAFLISNLEFGKQYHWRVRAKVGNIFTDYSEVWSFDVVKSIVLPDKVNLLSPVNGAIDLDTTQLTLTWESSNNATKYLVEVSTESNFGNLFLDENNVTNTDYKIQELESDIKHYWRVKAFNNDGESDYSDVWTFTTIAADPNTKVNIANYNGQEYKIFPNPAGEYIILEVNQGLINFDIISLYDLNGNFIKSINIVSNKTLKIDISELTSSSYLLKLTKGNETLLLRFIKK